MLDSGLAFGLRSPPRPSAILRPGIPVWPPGVERYRVRSGGSVTVNIFAGDEVILTDLEGLQPCTLIALDESGRYDTGILGAKSNMPENALGDLLTLARKVLKGRAAELTNGQAVGVFGE